MDDRSRNIIISLVQMIRLRPRRAIVKSRLRVIFGVGMVILLAGCGGNDTPVTDEAMAVPTETATAMAETVEELPVITAVALDRDDVPRYESLEMAVELEADYDNPYDAREVRLDGLFVGPNGTEVTVPGFWDGEESWRIRFTPSQKGEWRYQLVIEDERGASLPAEGRFVVSSSDQHGWLQAGDWVNPEYSGRYLVYHDGTPFYGVGHGDALNILVDGFDIDNGVRLFNNMRDANENYVVWWPNYTNSPLSNSYDDYSTANMDLIDLIVRDAEEKGIFLIFTIWDHPQLRDENHEWGTGNWTRNGFSELVELENFFTSEEAWSWQENYYRYIIGRWGHSPAIGMWQTVSEINGTNAYEQADAWHEKVNAYFIENDPYRHPTTASMSGDRAWPEGHALMDVPQVHVYELEEGAVKSAEIIANWTETMWQEAEKPNWVGEFGVGGNSSYPEMFHNSIWAALAAGAAMTPAEWNGGSFWVSMTPEMYADSGRLAQFVEGMPLAAWDPDPLQIGSSDKQVRGWGVAGEEGGLFWVQDFGMEGRPINEVRQNNVVREGVELEIEGLGDGAYTVLPYDTWQGVYLDGFELACEEGQPCVAVLPEFQADMAFKLERR